MATREWPQASEGGPYTFEPVPLGMQSGTDSLASPYQEGHTPPEAALDPVGFYEPRPDDYSSSPLDFYQWWHNVSEWRKSEAAQL